MSGDYGILEVAAAMDRSAALLEAGASTSGNSGVVKARAVFFRHMSGVVLDWVSQPQHTSVDDDIL